MHMRPYLDLHHDVMTCRPPPATHHGRQTILLMQLLYSTDKSKCNGVSIIYNHINIDYIKTY